MASVWIVHRDARLRGSLARMAGAARDAVAGGPSDRLFEDAPSPDVVVLGVAGDFEQELEFAHQQARRHPEAGWILLAGPEDAAEARRLFDTLAAQVVAFPREAPSLARRVRAARARRRAQALSERRARDVVAARFARWFADLELPAVLRALDPRLAGVPLLVRGEPGTGRGLLAAYVHAFGGTRGGRLVRIPCEGLDLPGLETEIARAARQEATPRGLALCLEDVERLPLAAQRRLRAWIEGALPECVAGAAGRVRWIATCSELGPCDPAESLDLGLAQVLAALEVRIPPLRERPGAIEPFAAGTALAWCAAHGQTPRRFGADALEALADHLWPGNLREFEGVVVRTLAAGCGEVIRAGDLRFEGGAPEAWAEPVPAAAEERSAAPEAATSAAERGARSEPAPGGARRGRRAEPEGGLPPVAVAEESLRRLIGAISHEVRNPLVAIRTFSQLLPERFDDPEFRGRFAGIVGDDVRRIEHAVDRLARFSALGAPEHEPVDVSALLDDLLEAQRDEIQERRLVVLRELDREHPEAFGDAAQLRFAFEALVEKALELVPERGDVYVASRYHPDGLGGAPGLRVLLRFQSPEEVAPSIGVEGISLAETALELVLADAVVRAHGGTMTASRAGSRETVILIDLPA